MGNISVRARVCVYLTCFKNNISNGMFVIISDNAERVVFIYFNRKIVNAGFIISLFTPVSLVYVGIIGIYVCVYNIIVYPLFSHCYFLFRVWRTTFSFSCCSCNFFFKQWSIMGTKVALLGGFQDDSAASYVFGPITAATFRLLCSSSPTWTYFLAFVPKIYSGSTAAEDFEC